MLDRVGSAVEVVKKHAHLALSIITLIAAAQGAQAETAAAASSSVGANATTTPPPQLAAAVPAAAATTEHATRRIPVPDPGLGGEQPELNSVIRIAGESYDRVRAEVSDYTCVLVRRERVDGRLGPHEFIYAKVRNRREANGEVVVPFSIYLKFLKPTEVAGREVLYVEGANDNEMLVRRGGTRFAFVTTRVDPRGELAMTGNRYPITEFGIENLLFRLIESARQDSNAACDVRLLPEAKIDGRPTTGIVVTHQSRELGPDYYQARIFVDKELRVPTHYECYDWPRKANGKPELVEQYTYTKLVLNPGLTDEDFNPDNPQYHVK